MDQAPGTEIIIIGTLHGGHNEAKHYTEQALKDIIVGLKPDAICVELYSKHFRPDGTLTDDTLAFCDQYPDVRAPNDAANELGIRQIPFDREGRDELYAELNFGERQNICIDEFRKWGERLRETAPECGDYHLFHAWNALLQSQIQLDVLATPDVINSVVGDGIVEARHSIEHTIAEAMRKYAEMQDAAEFLEMDSEMWHDRNGIMAENLVRIASDFAGRRLVVTTGGEHRYMLRRLLADKPGIVLREYWEVNGQQ